MACRRSVTRHRVRPKSLRHCAQFRQQNLFTILSTQGSTPSTPLPTASQHGATLQLVSIFSGLRRLGAGPHSSRWRQGRKAQLRPRNGSCMQPTTGASTNQPQHTNSSQLVCHPSSSSRRVGPPHSRPNHGVRSARDLVRIRLSDAMMRCVLSSGSGLRRDPSTRGPDGEQPNQAQQLRRALCSALVPAGVGSRRPT